MALRGPFGVSSGDIMRDDAMPCSMYLKAFTGLGAVFGGFIAWPLCYLHYSARTTRPRVLRWTSVGAVAMGALSGSYIRLWEPACEPQNIEAYDKIS
eukprot:jgi/Mesen1/6842/ME000351S05960